MEYANNYHKEQEQHMHSILDKGFNAMRRSFDKSSNGGRSASSSRPSSAIRKKSQLRKVLDDFKSNNSSIGTYSEDLGYKYSEHTMQNSMYPSTVNSGQINIQLESPMK